MNYRIEKDTLGEVKVPADKLWGAQTERSLNNFKIGKPASMPLEIIYGFAYLKNKFLNVFSLFFITSHPQIATTNIVKTNKNC